MPNAVNWLDWFGYLSSAVILVSLMMSSIIRLRWINLTGAAMFASFGFLIGSIPTATLNLGIAVIDIYYLVKLYRARSELAIVEADLASDYFEHFWNVNEAEIRRVFGETPLQEGQRAFYFLRNNNTAGVIVGRPTGEGLFHIDVDYVTPEYRDFAIGLHFIAEARIRSVLPSVTRLTASCEHRPHTAYLRRMGFQPVTTNDHLFEKSLEPQESRPT